MKRLKCVLVLSLFLIPSSCDTRVTEPAAVPLESANGDKLKIKDGLFVGPAPQIVSYSWESGGLASPRMMLWQLTSTPAPIDLTPPGYMAVPGDWSPDGTELAFWVAGPTGQSDIAVMDVAADGTPDFGSFTLVTDDLAEDARPAWSPDGTMLAWACEDGPNSTYYRNTAICYSKYDATSGWGPKVQLTTDPAGATYYTESGPSWSPRSDKLVFSRLAVACDQDKTDPLVIDCPFKSWDIFTYDFATATVKNETQSESVDEEDPSWEPKGGSTLIAFHQYVDDDCYDLYTWELGSTVGPRQLTAKPGSERSPWWGKDGKQLTYTDGFNHPGSTGRVLTDVYIMDASKANDTNLTNSPTQHDWFGRLRPTIKP